MKKMLLFGFLFSVIFSMTAKEFSKITFQSKSGFRAEPSWVDKSIVATDFSISYPDNKAMLMTVAKTNTAMKFVSGSIKFNIKDNSFVLLRYRAERIDPGQDFFLYLANNQNQTVLIEPMSKLITNGTWQDGIFAVKKGGDVSTMALQLYANAEGNAMLEVASMANIDQAPEVPEGFSNWQPVGFQYAKIDEAKNSFNFTGGYNVTTLTPNGIKVNADRYRGLFIYTQVKEPIIGVIHWTNSFNETGIFFFMPRVIDGEQYYPIDLSVDPVWKGEIKKFSVEIRTFDFDYNQRFINTISLPKLVENVNLFPGYNDARSPWQKNSILLDTILPGSTYLLSGVDSPKLTMTAIDGQKQELQLQQTETGNVFEFTAPQELLELQFTFDKVSNPFLSLSKKNPEQRASDGGTEIWRSPWIWYPEPMGDRATRYFKKSFELTSLPQRAKVWISADDEFVLYLNDKKIGEGNNWSRPSDLDLLPALKKGNNNIRLEVTNGGGPGGVAAEFCLIGSDGQEQLIVTDPTWDCATAAGGEYVNAVIVNGPPAPYRNVGKSEEVVLKNPQITKENEKFRFETSFTAPKNFSTSDQVIVIVEHAGMDYLKRFIKPTYQNNVAKISIDMPVEKYWRDGEYSLRLLAPNISFVNQNQKEYIGSFTVSGNVNRQSIFPASSIVWENDVAYIQINGEKKIPYLFHYALGTQWFEIANMNDLGVEIFALSDEYFIDPHYTAPGKFDFSRLEKVMLSTLSINPKAKIFFCPSINMPAWWQKKYPDDVMKTWGDVNGRPTQNDYPSMQSPASKQWRVDGSEYLRQMMQFLEENGYAESVIGIFPSCLLTIEWVYPPTWLQSLDQMTDYSGAFEQALREYMSQKYPQRAAAGEFRNLKIPSPDYLNDSENAMLRDPAQAQLSIDFYECRNQVVFDTLNTFCKTIKEFSNNRLLSGSYYGYTMLFQTQNTVARSGHTALNQALQSPYIDVLISPSDYLFRLGSSPAQVVSPADSVRNAKKLWLNEDDIRSFPARQQYSFSSSAYYHGKTDTVRDAMNVMRKFYAQNRAQSYGFWWYDLDGGYYVNHPFNNALMGNFFKSLDDSKYGTLQDMPLEVAFVLDAESSFYERALGGASASVMRSNMANLNRLGVARAIIQTEDFLLDNLPDYKMYIFMNQWAVSNEIREQIHRKLEATGAVAVWVYADGYFTKESNMSGSVKNIEQLTGFAVNEFAKDDILTTTFTKGKFTSTWNAATGMIPSFRLAAGNALYSSKKIGNWTSYYFANPLLNPAVLREIAKEHGVNIYFSGDDHIYAGNGFIGLVARSSGIKLLQFPSSVDIVELETGKMLKQAVTEYSFDGVNGEVYLFKIYQSAKEKQ